MPGNGNGNSRHEHRKEIISALVKLVRENQGKTFNYLVVNSPYSPSVTRWWLRDMSIKGIIDYRKFGSRGEAEIWLSDQADDALKKLEIT